MKYLDEQGISYGAILHGASEMRIPSAASDAAWRLRS